MSFRTCAVDSSLYADLVYNHLSPFVRDRKQAQEETLRRRSMEDIASDLHVRFLHTAKETLRKRGNSLFSEQYLLDVYLEYAFSAMHARYAYPPVEASSRNQARSKKQPLSLDAQRTHCEKLSRAVWEALSYDFQGASVALPTEEALKKRAWNQLQEFYDRERVGLVRLDLRSTNLSCAYDPPPSRQAWTSSCLHRLQKTIPSSCEDDQLIARYTLLEGSRNALERWQLIYTVAQQLFSESDRLYRDTENVTTLSHVPSKEVLLTQVMQQWAQQVLATYFKAANPQITDKKDAFQHLCILEKAIYMGLISSPVPTSETSDAERQWLSQFPTNLSPSEEAIEVKNYLLEQAESRLDELRRTIDPDYKSTTFPNLD